MKLVAHMRLSLNKMLENNIVQKKQRIWELDLVRGILLILVTWDHIGIFGYCWNIIGASNAFGIWLRDFMFKYLDSGIRFGFQPVLIWALVLMSGINCTFSRNHTRRAIEMLIFDLAFVIGYTIIKPHFSDVLQGETIFNILTIFALSFVLWVFIEKFNIKSEYLVIFGVFLILFGLYYYLRFRTTLIGEQLTLSEQNEWLFFLIYNTNAYTISFNNFEPLLPSLGFFLLGGAYGRKFYARRESVFCKDAPKGSKPVLWIGKHSLSVFVLGAPILVALMWLLSLIKIL